MVATRVPRTVCVACSFNRIESKGVEPGCPRPRAFQLLVLGSANVAASAGTFPASPSPANHPTPMAPQPAALVIPDISAVTTSEGKPQYNGDKTLLPMYLVVLERWLPLQHPAYRTLIELGYIIDRNGKVMVYSTEHAASVIN